MEQQHRDAIKKIVQLTKQDKEFGIELRKALEITPSANNCSNESKDLEHIETYLGLDYYVDSQQPNIDYSFIQYIGVRNQLISDNREMMRYRYGTRSHAISFDEYCRYAHLQIEMLLNYYYTVKNDGNLQRIKEHIKQFNARVELSTSKSIRAISYSAKLWAFSNEFGLAYFDKLLLENICKVRNNLSHRSPNEEEEKIKKWKKQLSGMNMPLGDDGTVNTKQLNEGSPQQLLYNNMVRNSDWYNEYRFLIWYHQQQYDNIRTIIEVVCDKLKMSNIQ